MIYLDNAATTWPKPRAVARAMEACLREAGGSPGRSAHRLSLAAERVRLSAREAVAALFGVRDPFRVIFTLNATHALNLVIRGLLPPGSHVVTTSMEHNAVMRPLREREEAGVAVSVAPCRRDGSLEVAELEALIGPETRLVVVNHASNVCGTVLPVAEIGAMTRKRGIPLLVDATQSASGWPVDLERDAIDLVAFTGHKGLLGPGGTGGLVLAETIDPGKLPPLVRGGTGSRSQEEHHPGFLPDRYEAGTPNIVGLAGLAAGIGWLRERGVETIREHERRLTQALLDGLRDIAGVHVLGTLDAARQTAAVSFTVEGIETSTVAFLLDEKFGVLGRPGLQCAPRAHRTLGTFPSGTMRLSAGPLSTPGDIEKAVDAVRRIAEADVR